VSVAMPTWILVLSALLTPAIAVAVGCVAFLQWRTAERKRRQELFDKRFALFQRLWDAYEGKAMGEVPSADLDDLMPLVHEAEFLFGNDVVSHMFKIGTLHGAPKHLDYEWFTQPFRKYLKIEQSFWR
jgi:hypothetical protein